MIEGIDLGHLLRADWLELDTMILGVCCSDVARLFYKTPIITFVIQHYFTTNRKHLNYYPVNLFNMLTS